MAKTEIKDAILTYMREAAFRPLSAPALADGMKLSGAARKAFEPALEELEKTAAVIKNRSGLYGLPEHMNLVVGKLSMSGKGYGFIIPDRKGETDTDVFVPGALLASAMHGDRVVARLSRPLPRGGDHPHRRAGEYEDCRHLCGDTVLCFCNAG